MAVPMANDPPFATLNHCAADLEIPSESVSLRVGITYNIKQIVPRQHIPQPDNIDEWIAPTGPRTLGRLD
jgi:hypothetical protein